MSARLKDHAIATTVTMNHAAARDALARLESADPVLDDGDVVTLCELGVLVPLSKASTPVDAAILEQLRERVRPKQPTKLAGSGRGRRR
jgi:hypothetical protein